MIEETLKEIGLNNRESICYIALLELGSSKVGDIIKKTSIPSSKIYEILDKLTKKGFASYVLRGKIKYYQASDPKVLINHLDERKRKIIKIMPELISKQKLSKKQSVEMFEGQKAIFGLFRDFLEESKPKELYIAFAIDEENKDEKVNLLFRNLNLRKKEKKLDVRVLKNMKYYVKEKHTKIKLRFTNFNLPQGITVVRDTVILLSWNESPVAIKIESRIFAKEMREFFLELWKIAKE